jgi:hypothetical protein
MRRFSINNMLIVCLLVLGLVFTAGCQSDPVKGEDDSSEIEWPDLTAPEDVIETIRLVYQNFNDASSDELMEHYAAILYDDPEQDNDYIWYMQPGDVEEYGNVMLREEDIASTRYIIEQASALDLDISTGNWALFPDVCAECLETTRTYTICVTISRDGEVSTHAGEEMRIRFVIGPNAQASGTWTIYLAQDLPKAGG